MSATSVDQPLQAARDAQGRHAWSEAFDLFKQADAASPLEPADLESMAEAAWWVAEIDDAIQARERAYAAYEAAGESRRAGYVALELVSDHSRRLSASVAKGWVRRAERLLAESEESAEYGYLMLNRARSASGPEAAADLARQAAEIGAKFGDKDLQAQALIVQGMNQVASGDVAEGLSLVDEATMAAVAGELTPMATGIVYCNTITMCAKLADYQRAGEWTEAARRWCERQSISGFPGVCRVHRAEIIRLRGDWLEAEGEARRACTELQKHGNPSQAAAGFYEIGEIRLRMGDLAAAAQALAEAHELGHTAQPGLSLLRLAEGNADAAHASITRALEDERDPLRRARLLPVAVEIALARDDPDAARIAADELGTIAERFGSTALSAMAATSRAAVDLAAGDASSALAGVKRAWRLWQEVDVPYEAARARLLMGQAYLASGDPDAGLMEIRAAKSAFERLGARPDVLRARELVGDEQQEDSGKRVSRTFVFTDIVGSTNLVEAIGDEAWEDLVGWHDRTLRSLFAEHGGEEVDHAGDGFFVAFGDPRSALECAVAVQRSLAEHRRTHGFAPQVRIGVHASEATERSGDYGGRGVHEAARIGAAAGGGDVLASLETVESAGSDWEVSEPRSIALKGISTPAKVVTINWRS